MSKWHLVVLNDNYNPRGGYESKLLNEAIYNRVVRA